MKMRVLRDKRGNVVASINEAPEDSNMPPLDVVSEDGGQMAEVEVQRSDLLDIDKVFEKGKEK